MLQNYYNTIQLLEDCHHQLQLYQQQQRQQSQQWQRCHQWQRYHQWQRCHQWQNPLQPSILSKSCFENDFLGSLVVDVDISARCIRSLKSYLKSLLRNLEMGESIKSSHTSPPPRIGPSPTTKSFKEGDYFRHQIVSKAFNSIHQWVLLKKTYPTMKFAKNKR